MKLDHRRSAARDRARCRVRAGRTRADWSAPDALSKASPDAADAASGTPTIAFDARGTALATWAHALGRRWRLARRPADAAAFRSERAAPYLGDEVVDRELPVPLAYGNGGAVALEQRKGGSTCGGLATRFAVVARTGRELRGARHLVTMFSHQQPPPLVFAGNRSGTALAAWIEYPHDARGRCVSAHGQVLRVAVHRPGTGFGAPVTLIRNVTSTLVTAAVGERGDMLVMIRRKGGFETRSRDVSGRWSTTRRLRIADERVDAARAAIAPDGAAWLLWANARAGVRTVSAAVRSPRTTSFGRVRVLERSPVSDVLIDSPLRWRLRIATPERGTGATAAWTSFDGAHLRVMVAVARGDDPLEPPARFTPPGEDQMLADVALRRRPSRDRDARRAAVRRRSADGRRRGRDRRFRPAGAGRGRARQDRGRGGLDRPSHTGQPTLVDVARGRGGPADDGLRLHAALSAHARETRGLASNHGLHAERGLRRLVLARACERAREIRAAAAVARARGAVRATDARAAVPALRRGGRWMRGRRHRGARRVGGAARRRRCDCPRRTAPHPTSC